MWVMVMTCEVYQVLGEDARLVRAGSLVSLILPCHANQV
jgi:hypothetical protein